MTAPGLHSNDGHDGHDGHDDHAARRAIREDLDRTLFVEAGAGTGKTTALVGRIVALIASGTATLPDIAAITFTEAAAGELRDRVREGLERLAAGERVDEHGDGTRTDEQHDARAERARAALAEVDASVIGTLHGFAQRILASFPFEAGLPPRFEVHDEAQSAVAFDERWSEFVDRLLSAPEHEAVLMRALVCRITLAHLREVAVALNRNWDLVADHELVAPVPAPVDIGPLVALLNEAAVSTAWCLSPEDKLLRHIEALTDYVRRLQSAASELEALQLLADAPALSASNRGQKGNWGGRVDEMRDLLAQAQSTRDSLFEQASTDALRHLLVALREVTLAGADDRRRAGRLEFHDLLVLARNLLRTHPEVAAQLGRTYRYLLIDEFQDTDPIQIELAVRIATNDPDPAAKTWSDLTFEPGRLFFVGDPKQAIYRFRRADIALFLRVRDVYVTDALRLTRNRRSVPGVIAWVNAMFDTLMGAGIPGAQAAYDPLVAHRQPAAGAFAGVPPVVVLGGASATADNVDRIRAAESAEIAAAVAHIEQQGWPVGDDGRPARLADMTILIPTRTSLPALQEALDTARVPYRVESSSLVYATSEVQDLVNTLRAIDDPADEVSVVAALRSPLFGCGDDDLLVFHAHEGSWDYRDPAPDALAADHPVVAGLAALAALHRDRWWHDVSGLIERVLAERRMLELGLDERRPREVWRRLRFVVDHARLFTDTYGSDLRSYLAWVELQSAEDARVVEAILPETDDDAVRIMTVHASKGLEFPVVVLAGLNTIDRTPSGVQVLWSEHGPEVALNAGRRTQGFAELAVREVELDKHESIRLLYVAATRARDHLVVSLHHKPARTENCHAARLEPVCANHPELWRRLELPPVDVAPWDEIPDNPEILDLPDIPETMDEPVTVEPVGATPAPLGQLALVFDAPAPPAPTLDATTTASVAGRDRWIRDRASLLASSTPRTLSATTVAELAHTPADPGVAKEASESDESPWRRGRAGTNFGRAVHATLQAVDLATGADLAGIARAQAVAEGVLAQAGDVERLARAALDAPEVRAAVAGGRYWRELYVGAPIGDRVLEGFVDLLVDGPDGYTVIDYKTDADLDPAVDRYRAQAAAYALAVEHALGRPVVRCLFLFLRPSGAVARELPDLAAAKAEVRSLLTS